VGAEVALPVQMQLLPPPSVEDQPGETTPPIVIEPSPGVTPTPGVAAIPKTGATKCYDESGIEISCTGTGQDGDIQVGALWPDPRFTDNGNGTITDNMTGLMWLKDANCMCTHYKAFDDVLLDGKQAGDGGVTWQLALDFVSGINSQSYNECSAGYSDWHLPNINELHSLLDFSRAIPAVPSNIAFDNLQNYYYWSSTTLRSNTTYAETVTMSNGGKTSLPKDSTIDISDGSFVNIRAYVLPVRIENSANLTVPNSAQAECFNTAGFPIFCGGTGQDGEFRYGIGSPDPRFTDNGDETITDNLTNLMWLQDANCMKTYYSSFDTDETASEGNVFWGKALQFINGINDGEFSKCGAGHTDWHLPNVNEIRSLSHSNATNLVSWLRAQGFNNVQSGYYTLSTTYTDPSNRNHSWFINTYQGSIGHGNKSGYGSYYVLPVREAN